MTHIISRLTLAPLRHVYAFSMFPVLIVLLTALPLVSCAEQKPMVTAKGQFTIFYGGATDSKYAKVKKRLKKAQVLEKTAKFLNGTFVIPHSITLSFDECDVANAFYKPEEQKIVFCYELLGQLAQQFQGDKEYEDLFTGTYTFVLLHELGHALIDVLNLPVTGREEDAADQLATWMLIDGSEEEQGALQSAAIWFSLNAQRSRVSKLAFADEHSLDAQRFFNILCWIYGHDPDSEEDIVSEGYLPVDRAEGCPAEFDRMDSSWDKLLEPHLKK